MGQQSNKVLGIDCTSKNVEHFLFKDKYLCDKIFFFFDVIMQTEFRMVVTSSGDMELMSGNTDNFKGFSSDLVIKLDLWMTFIITFYNLTLFYMYHIITKIFCNFIKLYETSMLYF